MNRERLKQSIRAHEGLRLSVYDDATGQPIGPGTVVKGHPTIGIGRALDVHGITAPEAEMLFATDVWQIEDACRVAFPWFHTLNDARQEALVEMAFQLGVAGVQDFHDFLAAAQIGDHVKAASELLDSAWAKQTPGRATELAGIWHHGARAEDIA